MFFKILYIIIMKDKIKTICFNSKYKCYMNKKFVYSELSAMGDEIK